MTTNTSTFWQSVLHAVLQGIVWVMPIVILHLGALGDMTVSGVLSATVFWLHTKYLP